MRFPPISARWFYTHLRWDHQLKMDVQTALNSINSLVLWHGSVPFHHSEVYTDHSSFTLIESEQHGGNDTDFPTLASSYTVWSVRETRNAGTGDKARRSHHDTCDTIRKMKPIKNFMRRKRKHLPVGYSESTDTLRTLTSFIVILMTIVSPTSAPSVCKSYRGTYSDF